MLRVCGIDPGSDVGLALICTDGPVENVLIPKQAKEVDLHTLRSTILSFRPTIVYLEKVHSMPGQGVASTFAFGSAFGSIKGMLMGLNIPYQMVTPQAWKKVCLAGMPQGPDIPKGADSKTKSRLTSARKKVQKQAAIAFAKGRYPKMSFRASERARTDNINMGDAACIAHYGLIKELGIGAKTQQTVEAERVIESMEDLLHA